jgi:hypothetical protein
MRQLRAAGVTMMMLRILPLCLLAACDDPAPAPEAEDPTTGASIPDVGHPGETTEEPPPQSTGEETTDAVRLDVATPQEMTCQKIDFLFVIDNSGSMTDEQATLIDGFPGFIEDIEASIEQYDYHMMVVTPDLQAGFDDPAECDAMLGAGRVASADGMDCGLAGADTDDRFADAEEDELAEVFACVAEVGTEGGGDEQPIWAMAQALTTQSNPGGCNEGFLRDDAILVVTIITDEEDGGDSPGDPPLWKEVIVSAKHGDAKAIVMLGLIGDTDLPDPVCPPFTGSEGAEPSPRLREFVESFPHGRWDSVCRPDYAPFFNAAIADIGKACTEFVPPG